METTEFEKRFKLIYDQREASALLAAEKQSHMDTKMEKSEIEIALAKAVALNMWIKYLLFCVVVETALLWWVTR